MDDPYLRERGTDVKDLGVRVLAYMQRIREQRTQYPENTILVGEEITPAMLGVIPTERLGGVVSLEGLGQLPCRHFGQSHGRAGSHGGARSACL